MSSDLIKSKLDSKIYRLIALPNGLRAVLVSDVEHLITLGDENKETDIESDNDAANSSEDEEEDEGETNRMEEKMAACALCVNVGSFSDPPEIAGLAHFLEHMVFMGSQKHPKENAFDEFLKKRGGSDNAVTDLEYTTFHFECREIHLAAAMDFFAQFFIAPLLIKDAMTRERETIDSEFELALPSDGSRFEQLLGSLAPAGHPATCFPWGNKVTLQERVDDDTLHQAVRDFWLRHYSAHRMTVAVVARLSLDTLEDFVRHSFSDVPNNGLPPIDMTPFRAKPWGPEFNCLLWVKPVYDLCEVVLTWVLPPLLEEYEARPLSYFASLLGHEGEGSLLAYLKKKLLCLRILAGKDDSGFEFNSLFCTFAITMELTQDGVDQLDEVLEAVFSYLAMLRKNIPDKRCFEEFKDIASAYFQFKDEVDAVRLAENLCEAMHVYKPEHYLAGDELYMEYRPELLAQVLSQLRPDNVNVAVHCKVKPDNFYNREEPWFKTCYKMEEIPEHWRYSWMNVKAHPDFHLPKPNPYITTDFTLLKSNEVNHPAYPLKALETPLVDVWYRQDLKFKRPVAHYKLYLTSNVVKTSSLSNSLLNILSQFITIKLDEEFYAASEAGYDWSCSPADFGLVLNFSGYNEKLSFLYEQVLRAIKQVLSDLMQPSNETLFDAVRADIARLYHNKFIESSDLNKYVRLTLLLDVYWTPMARIHELEHATLSNLNEFSMTFLSNIKCHILVQGNVSDDEAVQVGQKVASILSLSPAKEKPTTAVWEMPPGREIRCRVPSFNTGDNNETLTNYYQMGPAGTTVKLICIIDLLMMLMNEPLFDTLRTQQQLGYDVSCETRDTFGIIGFSVTVQYQSSKFTADEVHRRIEGFLTDYSEKLRLMPAEELEEAKENLCALKKTMDTGLKDEVTRNFAEISSYEYKFDRLVQEVEQIPKITQDELCSCFEKLIGANTARKLSVQITCDNAIHAINNMTKDYSLTPICPNPDQFISDLEGFMAARQFYPPQVK